MPTTTSTATTPRRPATLRTDGATARSRSLAGLWPLVRLMLRRDRVKLPAWVVGHGLFVLYIGAAVPQIAPTEEDLAGASPMLTQPIGRMFAGPAYGLDNPTYATFFSGGYSLYLFILAALMSIQLVARHTRLEEQSGRAELVRANVTGRHAQLAAALVVAGLANAAAGLVVGGLAISNGFPTTGSMLVGAAVGLTGMAFAGVAAITAQLTEHSRAASGMAGLALGVAFTVRALGDMAAVGGSALSWLSPLGWASQVAPYVLDRFWPLLLSAALAVTCVAAAFAIQGRRDLGAGLMAARRGRAAASAALGTPWGLAARLQRTTVLAWGGAIVALGVVDGLFTQIMIDSAEEMPAALQDVFAADALAAGYLAFLAVFSGYLTAAFLVYVMQGLRREERSGRAEAVLATPTSRTTWALSHLVVAASGATLIMLTTGLLTGVAAVGVTGDQSMLSDSLLAHANLVPAVLVTLAICALALGWAPSLLAPVGWALVAVMVFVGNFATLLQVPDWVFRLSPLDYPAQVPVEQFELVPLLTLLAVVTLILALGLTGLRRRDVAGRS